MLESLLIRNIALFEEAEIHFAAGLNVLTGETGAGKSLVVDAVSFLCGARIDRAILRTGSDRAYVEGCFYVSVYPNVMDYLSEQALEPDEGRLVISREYFITGRNVYRVGGVAVSSAMFRDLSSLLIDLHGQHEHQSLLQESRHLAYLDSFGNNHHVELLQQIKSAYQTLLETGRIYRQARETMATASEKLQFLRNKQNELRSANLREGEEEELQQSRTLLRNTKRINDALQEANILLADPPDQEATALSLAKQALKALNQIADIDPRFALFSDRLSSAYYEIEELAHDISRVMSEMDSDGESLAEVETRIDFLRKIRKKYNSSVEEMIRDLQSIESEIAKIDEMDEHLDHFRKQAELAEHKFFDLATRLSLSRAELAKVLETELEDVLSDLNMTGTRFSIQIRTDDKTPYAHGTEQVTMMVSPNQGEDLKPLTKIASGGELSRLMLAMKALTAEKNEVPTMVFDEIDTGVSGKTAIVIARKMWDIARYRQVICVTHLHQLASMANVHLRVSKYSEEGRTQAEVKILEKNQRTVEIANMLGDIATQGESSLQHAEVLLRDAAAYRVLHPMVSS